jgi:tRNA U34 5-carboxymethylaminomethyl modifying enzyme MnmG/GidA
LHSAFNLPEIVSLSLSLSYFSGTPPRLDGRSIDYSVCTVHDGDDPPVPFSFMNATVWIKVAAPRSHSFIGSLIFSHAVNINDKFMV